MESNIDSPELDSIEIKTASIDVVSIDSLADKSSSLELADVITAIDKASKLEIKNMTLGFGGLKAAIESAFISSEPPKNAQQKAINKQEKGGILPELREKKAKAEAKAEEPRVLGGDYAENPRNNGSNKQDKGTRPRKRQLDLVEVAIEQSEQEQPKLTPIQGSGELSQAAPVQRVESSHDQINTSTNQSFIDGAAIAKYTKDSNGRLRNENGAFASKLEQKQYEKAQAKPESNDATAKESEKQTSLLKQLVLSSARIAFNGANKGLGEQGLGDRDSVIKNSAGLAIGGSYFVAAQEAATVLAEVKNKLKDSGINSVGDAINKVKETASKSRDSVVNAGKKTASFVKAVQVRTLGRKDVDQAVKAKKEKLNGTDKIKGVIPKWLKSKSNPVLKVFSRLTTKRSASEASVKPQPIKEKQDASADKPKAINTKAAPAWIKSGTNPLFKFLAKLVPKPTKVDEAMLTAQKDASKSAEQQHAEKIIALGDIKDAVNNIKINGGGGGGFLSDAMDFLGDRRKKRKGRNARGGRTGRFSRGITGTPSLPSAAGRTELPARTRPAPSLARGASFGAAGTSIPSVAAAGGGKMAAGGMMGKAARLGGTALSKLALPLTVAMAAYDGVSGYSDSEGQKEAFKLKEGQEASTGQKLAMGAGSMLSFGGLTDLFGISGADIAKGLYTALGGEIDDGSNTEPTSNDTGKKTTDTVSNAVADTQPKTVLESVTESQPKTISNTVAETQPKTVSNTVAETQPKTVSNTVTDKEQAATKNSLSNIPPSMASDLSMAMSGAAVSNVAATAIQPINYVEDIEQIESVNKLKNDSKRNNSDRDNRGQAANTLVSGKADPEVIKILKSIEKKLDNGAPVARTQQSYRFGSSPQKSGGGGGIPSDFSNSEYRKQANNLG